VGACALGAGFAQTLATGSERASDVRSRRALLLATSTSAGSRC